jgi:hypothetical protein
MIFLYRLIMFLANLLWLGQTLVPLLHRAWHWDSQHQLHFAVWWEWLGFRFATDDVVVKHNAEMERRCAEAMERGEYQTLENVIAELKAKHHL